MKTSKKIEELADKLVAQELSDRLGIKSPRLPQAVDEAVRTSLVEGGVLVEDLVAELVSRVATAAAVDIYVEVPGGVQLMSELGDD